jgi:hypothetical protein
MLRYRTEASLVFWHDALEHLTFAGLQIRPPEVQGLEEKRPRKTCLALVPAIVVLLEHPHMEIPVGSLGDGRLKHCDVRCREWDAHWPEEVCRDDCKHQ